MKPGYKTTEFWLTFGTFIASGLYLLGVINSEIRDSLTFTSHHTIESIGLIIAQVAVIIKYISSRKEEKTKAIYEAEKTKRCKITKSRRKKKTKEVSDEPTGEN